jgi:hypothetical protein
MRNFLSQVGVMARQAQDVVHTMVPMRVSTSFTAINPDPRARPCGISNGAIVFKHCGPGRKATVDHDAVRRVNTIGAHAAAGLIDFTSNLRLDLVDFTAECRESILARHDGEVYQGHCENQWGGQVPRRCREHPTRLKT